MLHTDERFAEAVEQAVTRLEKATDAELVVVAAPRSGSYDDLALLVGVTFAGLLLLFAVFAPVAVDPAWLPPELLIGLFGAAWLARRSPWVLRLCSDEERRSRQVRSAAAAAFHEEQVHATRQRNGLLIYVSAMEKAVLLLPDHGLDRAIPHAEWNAIRWDASTLDGFLRGLDETGAVLARHIPPVDGEPRDELPNAPRVRP